MYSGVPFWNSKTSKILKLSISMISVFLEDEFIQSLYCSRWSYTYFLFNRFINLHRVLHLENHTYANAFVESNVSTSLITFVLFSTRDSDWRFAGQYNALHRSTHSTTSRFSIVPAQCHTITASIIYSDAFSHSLILAVVTNI